MLRSFFLLLPASLLCSHCAFAQQRDSSAHNIVNYGSPREYEIGGINISGTQYLDPNVMIGISGLKTGTKIMIPGDAISKAIENLWQQGLFSDVSIYASKIDGNVIYLEFDLKERPRLSRFEIKGIKKGEADKVKEKLNLSKGKVVTKNLISNAEYAAKKYFIDKGFLNTEVTIKEKNDSSLLNSSILQVTINKKKKVKIHAIQFTGNTAVSTGKLYRTMKDTKRKLWYNVLGSSKFNEDEYEGDKAKIIERYNSLGYRDAKILRDSVYRFDEKTINIDIALYEGPKYYFRNISWLGNTKHSSQELAAVLGIKKGDIFNQTLLNTRLNMNPNGRDVSSLYMDDGYLFFQVNPVEVLVEHDSIDLEMRIYEGKQARVSRITISGNTRTHDRVIMREIRTKPGQLFSRSDLIRSQRELAQLGYFNPEKLGVNPVPNPADGTVDIEYIVEEKPSDQVEVSGGWGGGYTGLVGTLGLTFNNFSARNFFNSDAWRPLPTGDGQKLSLRAQSNGKYYQSYNISFTEPWLGGTKPNSLSVSAFHSVFNQSTNEGYIKITGASTGFGKRLKIPDDYFSSYTDFTFQHYQMHEYSSFIFGEGYSNNFSVTQTFSRNSIDQPIYPRSGSQLSVSIQATPPYSVFDPRDYSVLTDQEKYKWVEFYKWKIGASWFTRILGDLVLNTRARYGFLEYYNKQLGYSPFERFELGGDGLYGFSLQGRDIIAMRGYDPSSQTTSGRLTPSGDGTVFDKYTVELRYPVSLNPQATVYLLSFLEGGNVWATGKQFAPFDIKRSAGFGVRFFLPMFGLIGFDWGYGFDKQFNPSDNKGQFHFSIGGSIDQ